MPNNQIEFEKLAAQREACTRDKADLFDFYHDNWDRLFELARSSVELLEEIRQMGMDHNLEQ